jgi:hypothetical protein
MGVWPALLKTDAEQVLYAEQVLNLVRGRNGDCSRDAKILHEAAEAVQWIKRKTAGRTPGQLRNALRAKAKKLKAAAPVLPDAQREYDLTIAALENIKVTSGGGKMASRIDAAKKRAAAECARDMLYDFGSTEPTLTRNGPFIRLAGLLFKLATGKNGDVERACRKERKGSKETSNRIFEQWDMLFETDGVKIFEGND